MITDVSSGEERKSRLDFPLAGEACVQNTNTCILRRKLKGKKERVGGGCHTQGQMAATLSLAGLSRENSKPSREYP